MKERNKTNIMGIVVTLILLTFIVIGIIAGIEWVSDCIDKLKQ